jgi:hypothetical protein
MKQTSAFYVSKCKTGYWAYQERACSFFCPTDSPTGNAFSPGLGLLVYFVNIVLHPPFAWSAHIACQNHEIGIGLFREQYDLVGPRNRGKGRHGQHPEPSCWFLEVYNYIRIESTCAGVECHCLLPFLAFHSGLDGHRVGTRQQLDRIRNRTVLPMILKA